MRGPQAAGRQTQRGHGTAAPRLRQCGSIRAQQKPRRRPWRCRPRGLRRPRRRRRRAAAASLSACVPSLGGVPRGPRLPRTREARPAAPPLVGCGAPRHCPPSRGPALPGTTRKPACVGKAGRAGGPLSFPLGPWTLRVTRVARTHTRHARREWGGERCSRTHARTSATAVAHATRSCGKDPRRWRQAAGGGAARVSKSPGAPTPPSPARNDRPRTTPAGLPPASTPSGSTTA